MVRMFQYLPFLKKDGWEIIEQPLLSYRYINYLFEDAPVPYFEIVRNYIRRISLLISKSGIDLIWLQQEAFPWFPRWFEKMLLQSKIPVVVDYDDAFFHRYDLHKSSIVRKLLGKKIDSVMNLSRVVIAGNEYLADRARMNFARQIEIFPTVVSLDRFFVGPDIKNEQFIIGWLGSPPTAKYLLSIHEELKNFCSDNQSKLIVIGSKDFSLDGFPLEIRKWKDENEVNDVQGFDIGIMPLVDSPWERGKCGFKLIQYMACGKPVIASPVGVNVEIVQHGVNGFLANNSEDWMNYFNILKKDPDLRKKMGLAGRKLVEEKYSLQATGPRLAGLFKSVYEEKRLYKR
jgi:glycosyltransferase involved in cell wall biosynthesis